MVAKRGTKMTPVHNDEHIMVSRLELEDGEPLYVLDAHFQQSNQIAAHHRMWDKIGTLVEQYEELGHVVVLVDASANTKANGDVREDPAGLLPMKRARQMRLSVVNHMGRVRRQVFEGCGARRWHASRHHHRLRASLSLTGRSSETTGT